MKFISPYLIMLLLANINLSAQITATVKDKTTGNPIPYTTVNVEGELTGTSADEKGIFTLPHVTNEKRLVLTSVGYETTTIPVKDLPKEISLPPVVYQLEEVVIEKKSGSNSRTLGSFSKNDINDRFGCRNLNWIVTQYFPYSETYADTPYIQTIKISTNSKVKDATFLVKLYAVGKDGIPGELLHTENIIGKAKKGKKVTAIDLASYNILFPEDGVFVGVEWLLIKNNLEKDSENYSPSIGAVYDKGGYSWIYYYSKGIWKNRPAHEAKERPVLMLAAELTLSN